MQPHERAGPTSLVPAPQRAAGEPYTTSEIIVAGTGINHRRVRDAIRKHQTDFEAFGVLGAYQTKTPNNQESGRNATSYILNEQQATFLLTLALQFFCHTYPPFSLTLHQGVGALLFDASRCRFPEFGCFEKHTRLELSSVQMKKKFAAHRLPVTQADCGRLFMTRAVQIDGYAVEYQVGVFNDLRRCAVWLAENH